MNRYLQNACRRLPASIHRGLTWLPYAVIATGVMLLAWVGVRHLDSDTGVVTLSAVAVTTILTIRQVLAMRDGHCLQAQNDARGNWDRFARLLQHGTDAIVLIDAAEVIRYATPSVERVLGLAPELLVGRSAESLADPDLIRERLRIAMARPLEDPGEPFKIPSRCPDGTVQTLEWVATRTLDEAKAPILVVSVRDVTERHAASEALRRSEAHNRAILAAIPDQILRFDRAGRFLGTAGAPSPGTAWTDDALGKTVSDVMPPALVGLCQGALDRAFADCGIQEISYSNPRPDGLHFFETRVAALSDQESLVIVRDVTSSREATAGSRRLSHILDATPDIVCSFSMDGRVSYANAAFLALVTLSEDDETVRVQGVLRQFPAACRTLLDVAVPAAVEHGFWRGDLDFVSDGVDAPISMIVIAHRGSGDATDQISLIGRDMRERRQTERDLTEAKDAADAASRAKGEFLATMSHEIRTPMNGVIGAVDLLLDSQLTAEQRDLAMTLRDSSEALLGIINDVLDFSKIEANSLELERIRFDLRATLDSVCGVLGVAAARKGLQLLVSIDDAVPATLEGDPARLRQILVNLVGNAVKFTERGEVVVRVMRAEKLGHGRVKLQFEVKDTGIGISPDVQARLFKSFAQADGSMSRRFGGTGLGLAISRRLVELMGGQLGVHSRAGDGSTFWFTAAFEADPASRAYGGHKRLGDFRILILDDKPTSRGILLGQFAGWGMRAFAEASEEGARQALRVAREAGDPFMCLVVDDPVAGLSGEQMASRFDAAADLAGTSLVVLGGSGRSAEERARLPQAIHLAKPVRASDLLDRLASLLAPIEPIVANEPACPPSTGPELRPDVKILLVEDNEVNQRIARLILGRLGYTPEVAADGFEAVRAVSQTRYDVVLMDCQMPGMDGFEAAMKIRSLESAEQHVPIVALTANATGPDRDACLAAGMDDYLAKPVRLEAMRAMLARWLLQSEPQPEVEPAAVVAEAAQAPLLDIEAMAAIRDLNTDGEEDMLDPLVDLFLEQAITQLAAIEAAIEAGDASALGDTAHTLKGAARNVGAALVGDLAAEMERRGKAGSADEAQLAAELAAALTATRSAFLAERLQRSQRAERGPRMSGGDQSPEMDQRGAAA